MKRNGFSLVELMVVITVLGILATVTIVRFSGSDQVSRMNNAEHLVRADILRAQSFAQIGKTCCGGLVPYGYGIVFIRGTDEYRMYAEFSGNDQFDLSTADIEIETVDLGNDELLGNIEFSTCTPLSGSNQCDVYFDFPSGDVYTNGAQTTNFSLLLEHTTRPLTELVTVDVRSGKID